MDPLLPIRRLRLELDRTLRGRAFFSRAVRGRLLREEYADLLVQLAALVRALATAELHAVADLGEADVAELDAPAARPGPAVELASTLRRPAERPSWSDDVALVVLGTPWASDALDELSAPYPRARRLLSALAERQPASVVRLERCLRAPGSEPQRVYALAELGRGALLGVATHLDASWPAPLGYLSLDAGGRARARASLN